MHLLLNALGKCLVAKAPKGSTQSELGPFNVQYEVGSVG